MYIISIYNGERFVVVEAPNLKHMLVKLDHFPN